MMNVSYFLLFLYDMSWYIKPFARTTKAYHSLQFHVIYWSIYCCRHWKLYLGCMHASCDCTYIVCVCIQSCILRKIYHTPNNFRKLKLSHPWWKFAWFRFFTVNVSWDRILHFRLVHRKMPFPIFVMSEVNVQWFF